MWNCEHCGTENRDDRNHCWHCSTVKGALSPEGSSASQKIRAELQRRRMPEPEPIVRTLGVEQSKQPMNSKITRGIIVLIVGVALIIISPSLRFEETVGTYQFGYFNEPIIQVTDLRNVAMFFGVALLIVGGIKSAVAFSQLTSTQPTTPPAPTTQPVVTQSVSPKSVELGNTPDEVQSVIGQPDKIINLGARVIHVYKDMKIIYVDGKVADVQ